MPRGHGRGGKKQQGRGQAAGGTPWEEGTKAKIREQFRRLDVDGNGTLTFAEVSKLLKILHPRFSNHQLQRLFCEMDANQNGVIEIEEFLDFMSTGKKAKAKVPVEPPKGSASATAVSESWKTETLDAHNRLRVLHGAPPLVWDDECYEFAKKQADACQEKACLHHGCFIGPSGPHGQNAAWNPTPGSAADEVVFLWYDELNDPGYDYSDPEADFSGTGHFTQVVWKLTERVGMAVSECGKFVVANYLPPGNFSGHFAENVRPLAVGMEPAPEPKRKSRLQLEEGTERRLAFTSITPELEQLFEVVPDPRMKGKIWEAFEQGEAIVSVTLRLTGDRTEIDVLMEDKDGKRIGLPMRSNFVDGC